jgi:LuxR family maltose regulon positive regulatory protein
LITAQKIHHGIRLLIDYQPPQMHLLIASREEPPLQIARLRARRQLVEIGPDIFEYLSQDQ